MRKDCDNCQWDDDGVFYRDNKYGFDPCINCTRKYNEPPSNWKLKQVTTSDTVEVTRCINCTHRYTDKCPMRYEEWVDYDYDGYLESDIVVRDYTEDNGFCYKGERSED